MKNARVIFWLLVATIAGIAANVFLSWRTPALGALPRRTLVDSSFAPTRVGISRPGAPETVLEKDARWRLVRPYPGTVDAQVILRLLDTLAVTPVEESRTESEIARLGRTMEDLGLADPKFSVTLSDGAETVRLSFGAQTPTSNGVYVAVAGSSAVLLMPDAVRVATDLKAEAFRERDIFPYEPEFVLGFDLRKTGESPVSFARTGEGWNVGDRVASSASIRDFLSRLTAASAVDFIWPVGATNEETSVSESRLVGYGLDAGAAIALTLRCRDGVDRRILLGSDAGEGRSYALVQNGGAIVTVDSSLKDAASAGMRTFVDERLFPLDAASVTGFTLTDGSVSYVVARGDEGAWRLDAPIAAPANSPLAETLLGRILTLTQADRSESGIRVSVSTNHEPCAVPVSAVLGTARFEDLRSSEILRVDAALVRRFVSTPGKNPRHASSVAYSRERKAWNAESENEKEQTVDTSAIERLLLTLAPLKASRVVTLTASASDLARYGLENPFHTLSVDQEKDGAVRRNIFIGAETKGGRFATVGSSEAIFVLPKKTVEALVAPLLEN